MKNLTSYTERLQIAQKRTLPAHVWSMDDNAAANAIHTVCCIVQIIRNLQAAWFAQLPHTVTATKRCFDAAAYERDERALPSTPGKAGETEPVGNTSHVWDKSSAWARLYSIQWGAKEKENEQAEHMKEIQQGTKMKTNPKMYVKENLSYQQSDNQRVKHEGFL